MLQEAPTYLVSRPLWTLSKGLLTALQDRWRGQLNLAFNLSEGRPWKEPDVESARTEMFLLDPGFGPATMLTADGRIVWEDAAWWSVYGTLQEAVCGVLVGIKKSGVRELAELLPVKQEGAIPCPECVLGFWTRGDISVICGSCSGLSWIDTSINLKASVL